jgi:hypothetical protein
MEKTSTQLLSIKFYAASPRLVSEFKADDFSALTAHAPSGECTGRPRRKAQKNEDAPGYLFREVDLCGGGDILLPMRGHYVVAAALGSGPTLVGHGRMPSKTEMRHAQFISVPIGCPHVGPAFEVHFRRYMGSDAAYRYVLTSVFVTEVAKKTGSSSFPSETACCK